MSQENRKILINVFQSERPLIGMIHFPPLIGLPEYPGFEYVKTKMLQEVKILERGGVDAIMIENNYDLPQIFSVTALNPCKVHHNK